MNIRDRYWIAGLLEGEGCFDVKQSKGEKAYPRVQINMNDRDVIERVVLIMDVGRVQGPYGAGRGGNPNANGYYRWSVSGKKARSLMEEILPIMSSRRTTKINDVLSRTA